MLWKDKRWEGSVIISSASDDRNDSVWQPAIGGEDMKRDGMNLEALIALRAG